MGKLTFFAGQGPTITTPFSIVRAVQFIGLHLPPARPARPRSRTPSIDPLLYRYGLEGIESEEFSPPPSHRIRPEDIKPERVPLGAYRTTGSLTGAILRSIYLMPVSLARYFITLLQKKRVSAVLWHIRAVYRSIAGYLTTFVSRKESTEIKLIEESKLPANHLSRRLTDFTA